ncbi:HAD family hydrolase [Stappia indica]|uniref:HAD family hydrolase n=1 Tax=Stappia indica TaxID=538381 RepID=UPI001CD689ED|nr:HAD-IA family hydrolase [Stappia indica]MCA1297344.1 HAD-IA family hydrolase [Stappia indica]
MRELFFFDCDGVLVDSEVLSAATTSEILAEHGIALSVQDAIRIFTGKTIGDAARLVAERYDVTLPEDYAARHEAALMRRFTEELREIAGIRQVLETCSAPVCVTSNSTHSRLALTLKTTDLLRYFGRNVFSAEDVAAPKPAPDLFRHAAAAFGVDPSRCITIDDSVSGIAGARAAGARAIGFCGGSHITDGTPAQLLAAGAEICLHSMAELQDYLHSSAPNR